MRLSNPFRLPALQLYRYLCTGSALFLLVTGAIFDLLAHQDLWIAQSRYASCLVMLGIVAATHYNRWCRINIGELALLGMLGISGHLAVALYQGHLSEVNAIGAYLFVGMNSLVFSRIRLVVIYLAASSGLFIVTGLAVPNPIIEPSLFALQVFLFSVFVAALVSMGVSARAERSRLAVMNSAIFDQSTDALIYGDMFSHQVHQANERAHSLFATVDVHKITQSIREAIFAKFENTSKAELVGWLRTSDIRETLKFTRSDGVTFWGDTALRRMEGITDDVLMVRITDVTRQVRSQAELNQTKLLLDRSQAMARVGGWEYNTQGTRWSLTASARHILQIPDGVDDVWAGLFGDDPAARRRVSGPFLRCLTAGEHFDIETPLFTYTGKQFQARALGEPITEDGRITRVVGVFMDISETRQREHELELARDVARDAAQARTQFLANMSHEIRTPMNGIIGMTSLLQATELNTEQVQQLETIRSSGDLLMSIINEILDFSKIDAGQMIIESVPFSLDDLIRHTLAPLKPLADEKGLALTATWAPEIDRSQHYRGDAGRIRQVLTNLIGNALKFTSQGSVTLEIGQVVAASPHQTQLLTLSVVDTGIGIDPARAEALFEPFRQAEASTTRRFGGTGLGLSISKRLTELMQGQLAVTSAPGVGSTFIVSLSLPRVTVDQLTSHAPADNADKANLSGLRVLVAEDNLVNQKVSLQILKRLRVDADLAQNGLEAVSMVQEAAYNVVLMDMQMPELDGIDATRRIRKLTNIEQPYIVAMTANALSEDKENCLAAGMDEFLSKPVRLDDVRDLLIPLARSVEAVS